MGNTQSEKAKNYALPLIKIINGKMEIVTKVPSLDLSKTRVISILGKARMGKSSFLNSIVTHITGENKSVFATKDDLEHCTSGIDYYFLEKENILLLDSQGLAHEDSSHDPALLLFIYLTSDVIIFNERMMLQNEALNLLQPICTFMNYVELEELEKPKLIFRISDGDIVKDPKKNLEKLLANYSDQYQTIRESIRLLFEENISIVRTGNLDRLAHKFLEKNDYQGILQYNEMGFKDAIHHILSCPSINQKKKNIYCNKLQEIVDKINNNEKIKIEKLDVVGLNAKSEIQEWILNLDPAIYSAIQVDGTQFSYEKNVEPRKVQKKEILTKFTKKFKTYPQSIREPYYTELQNKLEAPIKAANEESIQKAEARIKSVYDEAIKRKIIKMDSMYHSFTNNKDIKLTHFVNLESVINPIYEPVKKSINESIQAVYQSYQIAIQYLRDEEAKILTKVKEISEENYKNYEKWLIEHIEEFNKTKESMKELLYYENKEVLNALFEVKKKEIIREITALIIKHSFEFTTENFISSHKVGIKALNENQSIIEYDLIKDIYTELINKLDIFIYEESGSKVRDYLLKTKQKNLDDKFFKQSKNILNIVTKNNDIIEFVRLSVNLADVFGDYIMTMNTFNKYIYPIVIKTMDSLKDSELCSCDTMNLHTVKDNAVHRERELGWLKSCNNQEEYIKQSKILQSTIYPADISVKMNGPSQYVMNLEKVFIHKLRKMYCRSIVNGWNSPSILTDI